MVACTSTLRAYARLARRQLIISSQFPILALHASPPQRRTVSTSKRRPPPQPPFPTVTSCPSPTCACADTPAMPDGLEIDRESKLNGVVTGYAEHVLVCTGRDDWPSKIEEESGGDNLAADLKELFGRGGMYSDASQPGNCRMDSKEPCLHTHLPVSKLTSRQPFHNVSVLNASFPSTTPPRREVQSTSAFLLPSFKYIPFLPRVSFDSVQALAKGYLLPEKLHPMHDGALSPVHRDRLTRSEAYRPLLPEVRDVTDVMVLICGHGGRDMRCGVMGRSLRREFEGVLEREGFSVMKGAVEVGVGTTQRIEGGEDSTDTKPKSSARVGLISHIGGHKFAGNVIMYIPPGFRRKTGEAHPLAGHGIWYGRVEPKHAEGLVRETIGEGNVVADMFRGGIDPERRILRL